MTSWHELSPEEEAFLATFREVLFDLSPSMNLVNRETITLKPRRCVKCGEWIEEVNIIEGMCLDCWIKHRSPGIVVQVEETVSRTVQNQTRGPIQEKHVSKDSKPHYGRI